MSPLSSNVPSDAYRSLSSEVRKASKAWPPLPLTLTQILLFAFPVLTTTKASGFLVPFEENAITAAGVVLPLAAGGQVRPAFMVLASCSGSLMFSQFNDTGFWMFKEYYNVSIKHTFAVWTVMESFVAVVGLAGATTFALLLPAG